MKIFRRSSNKPSKQRCSVTVLLLMTATLGGCEQDDSSSSQASTLERSNPAADYCVEQGGEYLLDNSLCKLPNGDTLDAWKFFRANTKD